MMMLQKHHLSARRRHDQETRLARDTRGSSGPYDFANAGNGFRPGTLPEASAGRFACRDICHVISGLDTTLADEAMADARMILSCNDGVKRNAQSVVQGDRLLPSCLDYDSRSMP